MVSRREGEGGEGMQGEGTREHKCWRNMKGIRKRRIQGNWRGLSRERRKGESWDGRNRRSWGRNISSSNGDR